MDNSCTLLPAGYNLGATVVVNGSLVHLIQNSGGTPVAAVNTEKGWYSCTPEARTAIGSAVSAAQASFSILIDSGKTISRETTAAERLRPLVSRRDVRVEQESPGNFRIEVAYGGKLNINMKQVENLVHGIADTMLASVVQQTLRR